MKQALAFLLAVLLITCSGCTQQPSSPEATVDPQVRLLAIALEEARTMAQLANNPDYLSMYSALDQMVELGQEVASIETASPEEVLLFSYDIAMLYTILEEEGELFAPNALPDSAKKIMDQKMAASIPQVLNGRSSDSSIMIGAILSYTTSYQMPEELEQTICLLLYPGNWGIAVGFSPSQEDTLLVNVAPLRRLPSSDSDMIWSMIEDLYDGFEVTRPDADTLEAALALAGMSPA